VRRVRMPDITTSRGYEIPGGWIALVPAFSCDAEYEARLTSDILPSLNHHQPKAQEEARRRIDNLGRTEFVRRLKEFIKRNADEYGRKWPHARIGKRLAGFDPEKLQYAFTPYQESPGRDGKLKLKNMLVEMANTVREAA
jgi:hypothetical protein